MSCATIRPELVIYHFGETTPELRTIIEEHLQQCPECLHEFLILKRSIETADLEASPSQKTRDRLRQAVADEFAPRYKSSAWSWWERPAAFLIAGATVFAAIFFWHVVSTGPGTIPNSLEQAPVKIQSPSN